MSQQAQNLLIELKAQTNLPTVQGTFRFYVFEDTITKQEYIALQVGEVAGAQRVPVRIHSSCFTSEIFNSQKCDCNEQLEFAMNYIQTAGKGVVIYLYQEGRGIGLINKIRAYALQETGLDTVEANRALGLPDDLRDFTPAKYIIDYLQIESVALITNNPEKVSSLESLGIEVAQRIPALIAPNQHSQKYLQTKAEKMHHYINF
jgi:GTP cyclohydrolase II